MVGNKRVVIIVGAVLAIALLSVGIPYLFWNSSATGSNPGTPVAVATSLSPLIPFTASTPQAVSNIPVQNCTYPPPYWQTRPEIWPEQVFLGEIAYSRSEMLKIFSSASEDPAHALLVQLYTAILNILAGADMTSIEGTLQEANDWLIQNPPGSQLSEFNRRRGRDLALLLEGYNIGKFGPGACEDIPPQTSSSAVSTGAAVLEPSSTSPTGSLLPTPTPTPSMILVPTNLPTTTSAQASPTVITQPTSTLLPTLAPTTILPPPSATLAPTLTSTPAPTPTPSLVATILPTQPAAPTLPPPPPDGVCQGTIGAVTVDNLTVPSGASCSLDGTRVTGNVDVSGGASLYASRANVDGNIKGSGSSTIQVVSSYVGGNIQVDRSGYVLVSTSQTGGSVQVFNNTGGVHIEGNTINGNLQCKENSPAPTGGGNTVYGNAEDQCAGFD